MNPLRTFDCKQKGCRAVMASAPKITDNLCDECAAHFADVRAHLDARGVEYAVDPGLVRGLDYYTRTAWEWQWPELGARTPLGRRPLRRPGRAARREADAGCRFRCRRRAARADARGDRSRTAAGGALDALFAVLADEARPRVHAVMDDVRAAGVRCDAAYGGRRLKRALELADRRGIPTVVIVGEDEWAAGEATLRDMTTGEQRRVALDRLAEELRT